MNKNAEEPANQSRRLLVVAPPTDWQWRLQCLLG